MVSRSLWCKPASISCTVPARYLTASRREFQQRLRAPEEVPAWEATK